MMSRWLLALVVFGVSSAAFAQAPKNGLTVVVMDPLAAPLSCPCVKGYAQRDYEQLARHLQEVIGRPVTVAFSESLPAALEKKTEGRADIVIGKRSVVLADAQKARRPMTAVAALTGKDGATTQTGLIVVPKDDPAKSVGDLKGYRIIFGPADCDEKHAAAMELLKKSSVSIPAKLETCAACSDGATTILEFGKDVRAATVISSYAAPLLEGCGTIKKGDLRVVGTTDPVPFVTAFVSDALPASDRDAIRKALGTVKDHPVLMKAIETKDGFQPLPIDSAKKKLTN